MGLSRDRRQEYAIPRGNGPVMDLRTGSPSVGFKYKTKERKRAQLTPKCRKTRLRLCTRASSESDESSNGVSP